MNKELIVSTTPPETRGAPLEDRVVAEPFIEREAHRGPVGKLHKGRAARVLPGMQSAFVDIGLERDAFLYVEDVLAQLEAEGRAAEKGEPPTGGPAGDKPGPAPPPDGGAEAAAPARPPDNERERELPIEER